METSDRMYAIDTMLRLIGMCKKYKLSDNVRILAENKIVELLSFEVKVA